jgi:hypothetical protein
MTSLTLLIITTVSFETFFFERHLPPLNLLIYALISSSALQHFDRHQNHSCPVARSDENVFRERVFE